MATILNIVYGSTTIQLNAGIYVLLDYTPRTPEEREIVVETAFADGGERPVAAYRNVSDVARVALLGDGSASAVRTAKAAIDQALSLARRRQQRGIGDKVYVEYRPDGYTETYRCELLGGRVELADEALGWQWADRNIEILIGWQRRFFWEGPEAQIYFRDLAVLVFDEELSDAFNLISDYAGLTGVTNANSNAGVLYLTVQGDGLYYEHWYIYIFSDVALTHQVGYSDTREDNGPVNIFPNGGSGLGGTLSLVVGSNTALNEPVIARWTIDTSGVTVWNHDDSGTDHNNYLDIAAAEVTGDLPAPLRLEITNWTNSTNRANNVFVAHNVLSDPANFSHMLEAEAASGGTTTADTTCSNDSRKALSWTNTAESELLTWTLSTAVLNACRGNYFRLLARFATTPAYTDLWVRVRIKFSLTTIWEGPQVLLNNVYNLQDLGVLQLPPYLVGAGDIYPLNLVLYGQRNVSGTHSLSLDFVQLSPLDGWRKFSPRGYGLAYGVRLVDDGIEGQTYTEGWATAGKTGHYIGSGERIMVWPNARQRLYFLHDGISGVAAIDRTLRVQGFYRPRRLTI